MRKGSLFLIIFLLLAKAFFPVPAAGDGGAFLSAVPEERLRVRILIEVPPVFRSGRIIRRDIAGVKRVVDMDGIENISNEKKLIYRNRLYFNYDYFLQRSTAPGFVMPDPGDFLMEPVPAPGLSLHPELLEVMYSENMRRVFFTAEVSPYFPAKGYQKIPWLRGSPCYYFGNAFWEDLLALNRLYRDVYGTAAVDFNSQMRRVEKYRSAGEAPFVVVFASLERVGAGSRWVSVWGAGHYYYFVGESFYLP